MAVEQQPGGRGRRAEGCHGQSAQEGRDEWPSAFTHFQRSSGLGSVVNVLVSPGPIQVSYAGIVHSCTLRSRA